MPVSEQLSSYVLKAQEVEKKLAKVQADAHQVLRAQMPTEERRESSQYNNAPSIQRDDGRAEYSRKKELQPQEGLNVNKPANAKDQGIRKILKLAAYSLALDFPHLSVEEITNDLQLTLNKAKIDDLEQKFKENMGEAELIDELAVDPNNPDRVPSGLDKTLLLGEGTLQLPNWHGGIKSVRFYQEGNRVGVILYTDRGNYTGEAADILEYFEKKLDDIMNNTHKHHAKDKNVKDYSNQMKDTQKELPKPTPAAKQSRQEEKELEEDKKKEIPKNVPKNPTSTNPYS